MEKSLNSYEQKVLQDQLYTLRIASGLTQKELADLLNVPQSFVSKIESGERRIDIIELRDICKCLDTNIIEFVTELEKRINESQQ